MSGIRGRVAAQGAATAGVLIAGIVSAAVGVGGGSAAAHAAPAPARAVAHHSAPTTVAPSTPASPPLKHQFNQVLKRLSHPAHESWSRLLVAAPHGATVTHGAQNMGLTRLSKEFLDPAAVKNDLHFNGYQRGVNRVFTVGHVGVIEEIWQFHKPTGAGAWYLTYTRSNATGPHSEFSRSFAIGSHGARGYLSKKVDMSGYHFGVGTAIEGDMIVHVRVFGTSRVTHRQIRHQLIRASRPVARGIRGADLFGHVLGGAAATSASVTT